MTTLSESTYTLLPCQGLGGEGAYRLGLRTYVLVGVTGLGAQVLRWHGGYEGDHITLCDRGNDTVTGTW